MRSIPEFGTCVFLRASAKATGGMRNVMHIRASKGKSAPRPRPMTAHMLPLAARCAALGIAARVFATMGERHPSAP